MTLREHPFAHVPYCHSSIGRVALTLSYSMNRPSNRSFVVILIEMKFSVDVGAECCYANARDVFPDFEHIDYVVDKF